MNLMFLTKVEEDYTLRHSGVIGKAVNTCEIKYKRTFFHLEFYYFRKFVSYCSYNE